MAVGWAKDGADQEERDSVINAGIASVRASNPSNKESRESCITCFRAIPEARRKALRGVQTCINCAS